MHHPFQTTLLAAASTAFLALAPALAHTLTLQLPDGSVEQIHYTGDVPPQVMVSPAPAMAALPMPTLAMDPSFATLARLSALLDQQEEAMMRLAASAPALQQITPENLPQGATAYIATFSSDGACTKRTEITYTADGAAPREVSDTQGDCAPQPTARAPTQLIRHTHTHSAPARLIQARATGPHPAAGLLHDAVWRP